jgi:hypothetical protein
VYAAEAEQSPLAARLDRLPITSFHRQMMVLVGYIFFFELGDINSFAFAAPAIRAVWHLSIGTIAVTTSATFFGMFSVKGGTHRSREPDVAASFVLCLEHVSPRATVSSQLVAIEAGHFI